MLVMAGVVAGIGHLVRKARAAWRHGDAGARSRVATGWAVRRRFGRAPRRVEGGPAAAPDNAHLLRKNSARFHHLCLKSEPNTRASPDAATGGLSDNRRLNDEFHATLQRTRCTISLSAPRSRVMLKMI
jgi:hypothetical protein